MMRPLPKGFARADPLIGVPEPKPIKFPMKFKEFLRRTIGGRLHGDRLHTFRKYWRHALKVYADLQPVPPERKTMEFFETETDKHIAEFNLEGVDERFFKHHKREIAAWRSENRIQQRRNAAKKRWGKDKTP
jgi:hypothetical protein